MDNLQKNDDSLLDEQSAKSFQSLIIFNDNLRKHIKLSLSIYKKLNNFDHIYIHNFLLNDNSETNTK
jgi:hypothetical protein